MIINNLLSLTKINLILNVMKTTILTIIFAIVISCSKDSAKQDPIAKLPAETQTGANTFGVTINGKIYIPRDPTGNGGGLSSKGMTLWGTSDHSWNDLEIKDGASSVGFQMIIHFHPLNTIGKIILKQSNFHKGIDSTPFNNIYFSIWDSKISNYTYYGSMEDLGEVNITKLSGGIFSGNFKGKFVRYDNPNDIIEITDGSFDIGSDLDSKIFP